MEPELEKLGYRILALSTDRPDRAAIEAQALTRLTILSDADLVASRAFRLTFREEALARTLMYGLGGIELAGNDGRVHGELPVPAVVLVRDGVVRFVYTNPDRSVRLEPAAILAAAAREAGS